MRSKLILGSIVLAAAGLLIGPRLWPLLRRPAPASENPAKSELPRKATSTSSATAAPLQITTFIVNPAPLSEIVAATGTLRADEGVELQAEINGKVVSIGFQEGAHVLKGDLLVKLNDADLRAMLQRAAWRRELAELKERRLAQLIESASIKQEDYDNAVNELNVQRAEVAIIDAQIAKTEIRAPFDGIVGLRFVSEGAFVNATSRVATLQNLDHIKIDFAVPEKYASRIKLGRPIAFTIPGGDRKFQGEIYAIDPRIDSATRTVVLRAVCPNPDGRLLPGGFANVEFTLNEIPDALLVPTIAVVPGVSEKNVFIVVDGQATRRAVQTGTRNENSVHIIDGLKPGDVVITSGLQQLRAGQKVSIASGDDPLPKGGKSQPKAKPVAAKSASE